MNEQLRIGIACYPTYGGSGVLATELGIALADRGHEIHFLSYEPPIRLTGFHSNVFYHQVSVQDYPLFKYPPYALALATTMAEVCELHALDVLHVHYAIPHLVSACLARDMIGDSDLKIVGTLHGTDITIIGNDPSYRRVTRYAIERADGITAVSGHLEGETRRKVKTDAPIEVIPNFVDLDRFDVSPCPEAAKLRRDGERLIVHVSNFRPVKRVRDLIDAVAILRETIPVRLLMVGDGPDRAPAERRVRDLGIADAVDFLGSQDNVEKILSCCDLFALPSEYESFGLAALEAMACGVPVLATDAGGLPEVVEDGITGRLHPPGDVRAIADIASDMLGDIESLRRMGRASRERAEREFPIDRIVGRYERYYRSVLGRSDGEGYSVAVR